MSLILHQLEIHHATLDPAAPKVMGVEACSVVRLTADREAQAERLKNYFDDWSNQIRVLQKHIQHKRAMAETFKKMNRFLPHTRREAIYEHLAQNLLGTSHRLREAESMMRAQIIRRKALESEGRHLDEQIRYMIRTRANVEDKASVDQLYNHLFALQFSR